MSILAVASEVSDWDSKAGQPTNDNASGYIDPAYARVGTKVHQTMSVTKTFAATPAFWARFRAQTNNASITSGQVFILVSSATGNVFRVVGSATSGSVDVQRWDGAGWLNIATVAVSGWPLVFGINVVIAVAGEMTFYISGSPMATWSGDTSALGDPNSITLACQANSAAIVSTHSELIVASHDVRSARLKTMAITGAGALAGWTGAYTDINAIGSPDDSFIASDVAGEKSTFLKGGLAADSLNVDALVIAGRFRRNSTGPTQINALARVGGVDYPSSVGTLETYFHSEQVIYGVNPATAAPWTRAEAEGAEVGVESVA